MYLVFVQFKKKTSFVDCISFSHHFLYSLLLWDSNSSTSWKLQSSSHTPVQPRENKVFWNSSSRLDVSKKWRTDNVSYLSYIRFMWIIGPAPFCARVFTISAMIVILLNPRQVVQTPSCSLEQMMVVLINNLNNTKYVIDVTITRQWIPIVEPLPLIILGNNYRKESSVSVFIVREETTDL